MAEPKEVALRVIARRADEINNIHEEQTISIRLASREGASTREIAKAAGVSHSTIQRIIAADPRNDVSVVA